MECFGFTSIGRVLAFALAGVGTGGIVTGISNIMQLDDMPDDFWLPMYYISPQEIFAGQIPAFGINFINPERYDEISEKIQELIPDVDKANNTKNAVQERNSSMILQPIIQKWYVAIRNLSLVGLMIVLLYMGIRIVISSSNGEKAKYKEHLRDWIIAMVLVVSLHYIMAFSITIVENITDLLNEQNGYIAYTFDDKAIDKINKTYKKNFQTNEDMIKSGDTFVVNLLGKARLEQQLGARDKKGHRITTFKSVGYTIIYMMLIFYTVGFSFKYLKRVIYMAFLTLIAPLVALTYPIDKLSDGKSQAFDMWLKEYIYNLLIQPFHLLLYTVLIGSALDLAQRNMIYALVVFAFMMPAEKILRRFFGFDKASTVGSTMEGVVGGALAMKGIDKVRSFASSTTKKGSSGGGANKDEKSQIGSGKIRTADNSEEDVYDNFLGGNSNTLPRNNGNNPQTSDIPEQTPSTPEQLLLTDQERRDELGEKLDNADWNDMYMNPDEYEPVQNEYNRFTHGHEEEQEQNNMPQQEQNDIPQQELKVPFKRKIAGVALTGGSYLLKGALTGVKAGVKHAPRAIVKGALGTGFGIAGLAAGLATGDLSNVAKFGVGGVVAGASVGNAVSNTVSNIGGRVVNKENIDKLKKDYESRVYTEEQRKRLKNERLDKQWEKNKDTIRMYKEKFGENYKQKMQEAIEFRKRGITDDKAIINTMNLKDKGKITQKEKFAYAKALSTVKDDKQLETLNKRLENNGVSKEKLKEINKNIRIINNF